ncbi:sce7726 family protein [Pseudoxanthomonas mexicana]|uniref:sce7726 family protein n=1 Tax=Pseudoxanthomonas mexicana TaxID=128785 RepID=UPI002897BAFB|nr:sce7726 family protein [Pseudoxanthomonas mexicana]
MREAQIKKALADHLIGQHSAQRYSFLEELRLHGGEVRADLVHVEQMHCFEIKSEADSLARLINQGSRYTLVFDRVTLVLAERHVAKAIDMLPPWWGVLVLEAATGQFVSLREAGMNVRHHADSLASVLTKDEALHILEDAGAVRGWRSKSLYLIQQHIAQMFPMDELKLHIRGALLARAEKAPLAH